MSRDEFMRQLEYLLSDIPEYEREDALDYYRDYLEEAGEDADEVIREFGSPERIASIIRSDLAGTFGEGGGFTDRGYEDERFRDPNYLVAPRLELPEIKETAGEGEKEAGKREKKKNAPYTNRTLKVILWIVLIVVAAPVLLGAGGVVFGITAGAIGLLVGAVALMGVLTLTLLLGGIAMCVVGIISMAGWIPGGLLIFGAGVAVIGLGIISLLVSFLFYGRFLPWLIRGVVDGIGRLVHGRRRTA